ncbi:uncharacterized protein [Montipora foliosa]|uniref:uncharacterized protein n=1 Tax=Montipora foliosa TaxID=591990 RepID=UPI0035F14E46
MTVRLTEEIVSDIIKRCRDFSRVNKEYSIREVASLVGTLISTFPGVQYGPLHYRSLDRDKMDALKRCKGDYEAYMVLSPESLGELSWWITHVDSSVRKITREDPHSILETDASLTGWGAKWGEMKTQGVWCRSEKDQHINCLELLAIRWGLLSLCHAEHDTHIRIMSDNVTAVCYINAMGGCQSDNCNRIAYDIWQWAIEKSIWLSAAHTPGTENCEADELSRKFNPNLEWSVTDEVFNQILKVFALGPTIDLFASRVNAKLPAYVSWKADPFARYVDAFTLNWASHTFYAFPPHVSGHATLFQSNQKNIDESFIGRTTTPPPGHPTVLDFLHDLYDKDYSHSSLNTARSAISALCTADNTDVSQNIGKHPLICRFLKGVFNEIPPIPKFQEVWPVEQVLDYLEQLTPLHSLKLKDLTMKLVMLIALVTGQRCQTLSYLDISGEHMKKFPTYFSFSLSGHLKQDKPGRVFGNVRLFQYPKETLCVYTTLERYIEVTQSLRKSSKLLISCIKPHNEVSSSTIGRWLKTCLSLANIDVNIYQAHSTRSASTTKAAQLLPIDVVMKLAGWSQESTFRKYYDKPGAITDQMSNAVLSTVEK